eukprot:scaffold288339_cov22-Tisochrysis_lutea.AAC.1
MGKQLQQSKMMPKPAVKRSSCPPSYCVAENDMITFVGGQRNLFVGKDADSLQTSSARQRSVEKSREREQKSMHMHACKLAPHAFCTLRQLWRKSSSNASNKRGHSQATRAFQLSLKNWLLTHSP